MCYNIFMEKRRKIKPISCSECEKMIYPYLDNALSVSDLEIIYNHIKNCPSCMEELSIQFLVTKGIEAVDKSDNYNLVKSLKTKLDETETILKRARVSKIVTAILLSIILAVVLAAIIGLTI